MYRLQQFSIIKIGRIMYISSIRIYDIKIVITICISCTNNILNRQITMNL